MINKVIHLKNNREDVTLTTYLLDNSREMYHQQKRPVVIVCPGGGYTFCSDREGEPVALKFNSMGYHAVVLRYSVLNKDVWGLEGDAFNEVEFDVDNHNPEPILDIGRTFLWLKEYEEDYLIDMNKVILCGFSAGGHNVLNYAVNWHKEILSNPLMCDKEQLRPMGVIAGYPVVDFIAMKASMETGTPFARQTFQMACKTFLGTREPSDEQCRLVSPNYFVDEKTPPMFLWTTNEDDLVPSAQTFLMAGALLEKEIPFELHMFEEGAHGLSLSTQATASAKTQINTHIGKWTELADSWLKQRVGLKLPEKTFWE